MDNEKTLSRGLYATRLLADEDFMSFFRELREEIQTTSFGRACTDPQERESVYFQLKGIHDVLGILETYSKRAAVIVEGYNAPVEIDTDPYDD